MKFLPFAKILDMTPDEIKLHLKGMFEWLTEEDLTFLANANEDINVLITRILDNNYKPITLDIKEIEITEAPKATYGKSLKYPEVFDITYKSSLIKEKIECWRDNPVVYVRNEALEIHKEASELMEKGHKKFATEYFIEADKKREIADFYNRQAAIEIMKCSIRNFNKEKEIVTYNKTQSKSESKGSIDLHGLFKKEALDFVEDLYKMWDFTEINFVTGQKMKNRTLRPALEEWFEEHGFKHYDLDALIKGKKL